MMNRKQRVTMQDVTNLIENGDQAAVNQVIEDCLSEIKSDLSDLKHMVVNESDGSFYVEITGQIPVSTDGFYFAKCSLVILGEDEDGLGSLRAGIFMKSDMDDEVSQYPPVQITRADCHTRVCLHFETLADLIEVVAPIMLNEAKDQLLGDVNKPIPLPPMF